jgi:hypothetical protein
MARIGAPHGWRSTNHSPPEWPAWFAEHPGRTCWLLALNDEPVGVVCYDPHPDAEVEIKTGARVQRQGPGWLCADTRHPPGMGTGARRTQGLAPHVLSGQPECSPQLSPPRISHLQDRTGRAGRPPPVPVIPKDFILAKDSNRIGAQILRDNNILHDHPITRWRPRSISRCTRRRGSRSGRSIRARRRPDLPGCRPGRSVSSRTATSMC